MGVLPHVLHKKKKSHLPHFWATPAQKHSLSPIKILDEPNNILAHNTSENNG